MPSIVTAYKCKSELAEFLEFQIWCAFEMRNTKIINNFWQTWPNYLANHCKFESFLLRMNSISIISRLTSDCMLHTKKRSHYYYSSTESSSICCTARSQFSYRLMFKSDISTLNIVLDINEKENKQQLSERKKNYHLDGMKSCDLPSKLCSKFIQVIIQFFLL